MIPGNCPRDHTRTNSDGTQTLTETWADGEVTQSHRPDPWATWSPRVTVRPARGAVA